MTGYEIIKANINFTNPERIGIRFDRIVGDGDVYRIFVLPAKESRDDSKIYSVKYKLRPVEGYIDEWGCKWSTTDGSGSDMGQVVNIPIEDMEDYADYKMPDPRAEGRFDGLVEALDEAEEKGLYVQLNSPQCIFERMHFLRGFEDALIDCIIDKENVAIMIKDLADFQIGIIEEAYRLGKGRIHCYDTTDDWGTQENLLIPPDIWRELFKPQYKRIFDKAHECGMDIRFHTDGKVNAILEDLIELGVDIINIHQPRLVGIDEVSKIAQGRVCFEAAIDIQTTLPSGDKEAIETEVKELVSKWATPNGGLIGIEYGYLDAIGVDKESMIYAYECFKKHGKLN
ncbi:MAG: hypothetical protein BEN19_04485 [Epulopiscium sp. Nuni2H_MBin003]|nr:MAG: hypothetical protein BEN19_04485 [Epulopiscium sp. Nuni2H_MBin003]